MDVCKTSILDVNDYVGPALRDSFKTQLLSTGSELQPRSAIQPVPQGDAVCLACPVSPPSVHSRQAATEKLTAAVGFDFYKIK